jgi:hypothetical protein
MSFFYDLNKKLDGIRATPEVTHKQLNERDEGKPGKNFAKIAKDAGERYGSKAAGERVAGSIRNKLKDQGKLEEGPLDAVKKIGKRVASGVNRLVGHGSDEDMRKDVQRKSGAPVTGKKPSAAPKQTPIDPKDEYDYFTGRDKVRGGEQQQKTSEAAKYRDPKYKDKLYTVEPLDYTYGPDADELYYNPKPDDYEGRKRKIGGGEFSHNDPLRKGFGRGGASNSINTHGKRKGMPSRDQITSLKGSIKDASGTHAEPNLPEAGAPMTTTGKKLNFADKIASAKKEVDEMLGDVAAEAMRSALSPKQKKIAGMAGDPNKIGADDLAALRKGRKPEMDEERSKGTAFDMSTQRVDTPKAGSTERGAKHDIKHSTSDPRYTGRTVTRRTDAQGISVGADDDADTQAGPRGRGRPKGTKGAIGAKGPSGKSKLMTREGEVSTGNLQQMHQLVTGLKSYVQDPEGQALLKELMSLIKHYATQSKEMPVGEEKTSTRDDHAEKAGKKVAKDIEHDEENEDGITGKKRGPEDDKAEKAGKKVTKDIEHDEKKKDEEVDESTTSGSVATSTATKSSKGGVFGKGIYDSMNRELENMIAESMTINMSDSTEGGKSLTITATDEDALKLGMLLKNAGLGGGDQHGGDMHSHGEEPCDTCGMQDCGCGDVQEAVDENAPDWPTNTEQANNNFGYAGGLDGPKTDVAGDGQSTVPVVATRPQNEEDALRRMMEMAGLTEGNMPMVKKDGKMVPAFAADGKGENDLETKDKEEDTVKESIRRMMEIAGVKKKPMDEQKTEEGNLFTKGLEDDDVEIGDTIPGTNAIKKKDIDESIFALNNQWQAYKG